MGENELYNPDASDAIQYKELSEIINKYGSLISILVNKHISCISFFLIISNNKILKDVLLTLTSASYYDIVTYLAHRYPVLNKSKKIK